MAEFQFLGTIEILRKEACVMNNEWNFNSYITIRNAVWFSLRLWSTSGNLQPQLLNYNSWGLQRPQLKRAMKSYGEGFIVLWFTTVVGVAVGVEVGFAVKH